MNDKFVQNVIDLRGDKGRKWLDSLPEKIAMYERKWDLTIGEPFHLSYNYTAPAKRIDGTNVVLKISYPDDPDFISGVEALKIFAGQSLPKLLEEDIDDGVILMEQVLPGKTLDTLGDDERETYIACGVLKKLWRPAPQNELLIQLPTWLNGFKRHQDKYSGSGPFPNELFSHAEEFLKTADLKKGILTHGDFHHDHILSSGKDEWVVVDPRGIIGHPLYDVATFLYNPRRTLLGNPNVEEIVKKRIAIFSSELGADKEDIVQWGITQSLLSAIWSLEDHGKGWEYGIKFAELLTKLK